MRPSRYFALPAVLLLAGCAAQSPCHSSQHVNWAGECYDGAVSSRPWRPHTPQPDTLGFEALLRVLAKQAKENWGDESVPSRTVYVKYTNHYRTRAFVDFARGSVRVETRDKNNLRYAIAAILLTPYAPDQVDLFSDKDVPVGEEPMLYGQVLDHDGQPIRWNWRALRYADYLIDHHLNTRRSPRGAIYGVNFALTADHMTQRQYHYADLVRKYAKAYRMEESLVYAVIRTESSFNPYAVSSSNAYGLMQIIPATAGKDVFQRVKKKPGQPSKEWLFQPHNNIDTGTAYLALLNGHYLKEIKDPLSRKYTVISAYNGGAGNVFNTFDRDRDRAIGKINQLAPSAVYRALTTKHPRDESRRYLEKVSAAQKDFHQGKV